MSKARYFKVNTKKMAGKNGSDFLLSFSAFIQELAHRVAFLQNAEGTALAPFELGAQKGKDHLFKGGKGQLLKVFLM